MNVVPPPSYPFTRFTRSLRASLRIALFAASALAFAFTRAHGATEAPQSLATVPLVESVPRPHVFGAPEAPANPRAEPAFYHSLPYGSEALVNPVRLIVNGGFGILQFDNRDNAFGSVRYGAGWHRVWSDVGHPVRAIETGGWRNFVESELLPISMNHRDARYWPNYTLHLVGGGMSYANMTEWYAAHGYAHPQRWAQRTLVAYHLLNEVVENDDQPGPTTDALTDLLIFDPAGVWLFSHPGVRGFFGRTLEMRDWSNQPAIDPRRGTIVNNGQNFSIKWGPRWSGPVRFFYYFGNHGEAGLSFRRANGSSFSAAGGFSASTLVDLGRGDRTAELLPSSGLFYDRNGSLLVSVIATRSHRNRLRVNAYPGWLRVHGHTAGAFAIWNDRGEATLGLSLAGLPVGVAGRP